ncbi:MAG: extracellular solute-binding protein [Clostridia bacterium]|nr:extracellular solute-binding protein [Clostridia bacterium]
MKKFTLLLALLMTFPTLASCTATSEDPNAVEDTSVQQTTTEQTETEPQETRTPHNVPDYDFGGADFLTAYPTWAGYSFYFFADELTGDGMNDAIYERKLNVENTINVSVGQKECGYIIEVVEELKRSVQAGDDAYQMGLFHCIYGISELATGNYLYNLDTLPNIDLSADWWNQTMTDMLRLGTKTYYGVNDYMIPAPYCIYFNKDLITQYQLDDPYSLVYSGEWTLDRFLTMAETITVDQNGDGNFAEDDIAGIVANDPSCYTSFVTGCDQYMTSRNENGQLLLNMNTEKMFSIVEKFYAAANAPGIVQIPGEVAGGNMFTEGNILFLLDSIASAVNYRETEFDLGILPFPKFDTTQENYVSLDWGGLMGVPASITNPEMVGAVIELLAYESANTVIPAYYDVLLRGKLARDIDTVAMMDLLFDTISYEIGGNYFGFSNGFQTLFYTLGNEVVGKKNLDFASLYAKNEKPADNAIKQFYKSLEKAESDS